MAKKDKAPAIELSDSEKAAQRIRDIAAQEDAKTVRDQLGDYLRQTFKLTTRQADYLVAQEMDRVPARQPKLTPSGASIARLKRNGETVDMLDESYWRDNHGDLIPAAKVNVGEALLTLGADAVSNLTIQSQMIKQFGFEASAAAIALAGGKIGVLTEKPVPGVKKDGTVSKDNPWANNAPGAEEARIGIIRRLGTKAASEMAKAAGVDLAGRPLKKVGA